MIFQNTVNIKHYEKFCFILFDVDALSHAAFCQMCADDEGYENY